MFNDDQGDADILSIADGINIANREDIAAATVVAQPQVDMVEIYRQSSSQVETVTQNSGIQEEEEDLLSEATLTSDEILDDEVDNSEASEHQPLSQQQGAGQNRVALIQNIIGGDEYQYIQVREESARFYNRFQLDGQELRVSVVQPPDNINIYLWFEGMVEELYRLVRGDAQPTDYIGLTVNSERFRQGPVWVSFRLVRDLHPADLVDILSSIAQSNEGFEIDDTLRINVNIVRVPAGRGRVKLSTDTVFKRSILNIKNSDNLCLPRSLVAAHAHAIRGQIRTGNLHIIWNRIRNGAGKYQTELAKKLVRAANVIIPEAGCGIREIRKFQEYYAIYDTAIVVYSFYHFARGFRPLYDGTEFVNSAGHDVRHTLRIMYYENRKHYQPILNILAAAGSRGYCIPCNKRTSNEKNHRCPQKCQKCLQKPPCTYTQDRIQCTECLRQFFGQTCFLNHSKSASFDKKHTVCESIRICNKCCKTVRICKKEQPHDCNVIFCKTCNTRKPIEHKCYMQPVAAESKNKGRKLTLYLFYDFETQQSENVVGDNKTKLHVVNLCVVQQVCTKCLDNDDISESCNFCGIREYVFNIDPVKQLVDLALLPRGNFQQVICIAHNAQGFDAQFVLKHLTERKDIREKPSVILNGTKIIVMQILQAKFLDSLNYLHMSLSSLPKAYGLGNIEKGTFPHLFNRPENQDYVGEMPPIASYSPESMGVKERAEFLQWYAEKRGHVFNFKDEIIKYCKQDVKILRLACLAFRETFIKCGSTDPFVECATIASTCMRVFRKNFLKEDTIGIIPQGGYRQINKQSLKAVQWLGWMEQVLRRQIQYAERSREKRLPEGLLVDGYCELDDDIKVVLQFQGCYWHGCIICHPINRDVPLANGDTMTERYERTVRISEKIRSHGYHLIEKWECQFDSERKQDDDMARYINERMQSRHPPLNPRDAFFGGRTGNTVKSYDVKNGEKIKYVDVCSLYPYICKYGRYPIGHPTLYVGEDECRQMVGLNNDISDVDGLIMCEVLPPRNLYHPVLPVKMHAKLLFPLCRTCVELKIQQDCEHEDPSERAFTGTWVADELKKAVELGYVIRKVYEIWSYEVTQYDKNTGEGGLFHAYIDKFFIEKTYASGYPAECANDENAIRRHIEEFERQEGIELDRDRINYNAGLRSVAKLCLNSLWGKFGQKEGMATTEIVDEPQRLFALLTSPEIEVNSILPIDDSTLYVCWHSQTDAVEPSPLCNVVIAAYTTALARLKLFSELEPLGDRVLYYDTDSIIYVSREDSGEYEPATGPFLGQLTDELACYGLGTYITSFVSGGPKFYAYKCLATDGTEPCVCKVKGVRLNSSTSAKINFESVRNLVTGQIPPIFVNYDAIRRTAFHDVVTRPESKICQPVYEKRRFVGNDKSYPYGYKTV